MFLYTGKKTEAIACIFFFRLNNGCLMFTSLRKSESEASSQLEAPGPQWSLASKDLTLCYTSLLLLLLQLPSYTTYLAVRGRRISVDHSWRVSPDL